MLEKEILAYALRNALEFGKAVPEKILPKLFRHGLKKEQIKEIIPVIKKIVSEINSLPREKLEKIYNANKEHIPKKEEKPHDLSELPNVSKKMVFRAAPYPSGALHIGNAKTFILNALYAEKYNGKILLVMDDTIGSEQKPLTKESYDLIKEAFEYLKVKYAKPIIYKSDRLNIYYQYAEKLIKKDKAYVCYCPREKLRSNREKGIECSCRQFPTKIQLLRWKEMFKAEEGAATLRIKTSLQHPNPAFRDRVLFKISEREHPRVGKKYKVWPTLEMSWAIDDHLLNITNIIRGNDLLIETEMERYIWDIFGWKYVVTIHTGLVKLEGIGAKISKSKSQEEVKSGKFLGWHDPRTWSIQSLEKRGIKAEAIREFVKEIGLNKQNILLPVEALYAINRRMIDNEANRFSFVANPVEIEIKNKPKINKIEVPIHPDKPELKEIKVRKIFISREDFEKYKGEEIRLSHLFNIELDKKKTEGKFISIENKEIQKISWVSEFLQCRILMPDGNSVDGYAEETIKTLKYGERLQFERFGFAKLEKIGKEECEFWFTHK